MKLQVQGVFWEVGVVNNVVQQRQLDLALRTWPTAAPGQGLGDDLGLGQGSMRRMSGGDVGEGEKDMPVLVTTLARPVRQLDS